MFSPTAPAYSLTMGSKRSSLYLWTLMWPLCSTYRSVHPSKDMRRHTIKDPLSKASCATMLHAAKHSPCFLWTLTHRSHVEMWIQLSSVKSRGPQWHCCQIWCSLANSNLFFSDVRWAVDTMQEFGSMEHLHTTALPIFDMKYTHLLSLRSHFLGLKQLSTNFEGPFVWDSSLFAEFWLAMCPFQVAYSAASLSKHWPQLGNHI